MKTTMDQSRLLVQTSQTTYEVSGPGGLPIRALHEQPDPLENTSSCCRTRCITMMRTSATIMGAGLGACCGLAGGTALFLFAARFSGDANLNNAEVGFPILCGAIAVGTEMGAKAGNTVTNLALNYMFGREKNN